MNLNQLIYRNLKKNLKNYYLYVFALIFSVALYFAFVTLQYDPSMDEMKGSVKGAAGIAAGSVLLVVIVAVFLLYANTIFIKRRSKEIGLFQLIGLTKGKIFSILSRENLVIYFGSMIFGILVGFASSRLLLMILFKVIDVEETASLNFSGQALIQTVVVFAVIYLLIMLMNYTFIKRQSILSLFRVTSTTENTIRGMRLTEMVIGLFGIGLILYGYHVSTKLFTGQYTELTELFLAMMLILGSVIVGTYLFYKGSVSFIFNLIRKGKGGYLSLNEVLSLSSIMFRMKSNALLLTIITTVSALAIGLLSLSYISYYSTETSARLTVPNHFSVRDEQEVEKFKEALLKEGIKYRETRREMIYVKVNSRELTDTDLGEDMMSLTVVNETSVKGVDVGPDEVLFAGADDMMDQFMGIRDHGPIKLLTKSRSVTKTMIGTQKESVVSYFYTQAFPALIVDESTYEQMSKDLDPSLQRDNNVYLGIDIQEESQLDWANEIFLKSMGFQEDMWHISQPELIMTQKGTMGLIMFVVAFLGVTFLITSGSILYFKQMGEGEEERPNYTILRKLGFTQGDLLRGIQFKQLFSFGIPLVVGLSHSYFAVKSGWFLFGTELWTPMFIVMLLYTGLYSIFGLLAVLYYKRVIKESLKNY